MEGPHNYCLVSTILQFQGLLLPSDLLKSDETVRTKCTDIIKNYYKSSTHVCQTAASPLLHLCDMCGLFVHYEH